MSERTPDLADVMAAAETAMAIRRFRDEVEFELRGMDAPAKLRRRLTYDAGWFLERSLDDLARIVNAVRAAQGQPPVGEPAYQPCPGPGPEGE